MPSFGQIKTHFPTLVIDAASSVIQVGWIKSDGSHAWRTSNEEAGVAVFRCIDALGVDPQEVASFVFCEGPGSVLGIRTVAMALRTWTMLEPRPVFAYSALAIVAHSLGRPDVSVIADARRDSWHYYRIGGPLRRAGAAELTGELVMPENFRHWSVLPANVTQVPYSLADLIPRVWEVELLRETDAPDAFLHEEPTYVTWTPQIHQANPP